MRRPAASATHRMPKCDFRDTPSVRTLVMTVPDEIFQQPSFIASAVPAGADSVVVVGVSPVISCYGLMSKSTPGNRWKE